MRSIRRFQLVTLVTGTAIVCAAGAYGVYEVQRRSMYEQFDGSIASSAVALATFVELDPPFVEFEFTDEDMPEFLPGPTAEYFQIWVGRQFLSKSASMEADDLPRPDDVDRRHAWNLVLPDGRPGRAVAVRAAIHVDEDAEEITDPPTALVVVARTREPLRRDIAVTAALLAGQAGLIAVTLVGLVIWTLGRGLAPIRRLGARVDSIDTGTLDRRLDADTPLELRPIVTGLNRMLDRIESGFARERRTTANIAHELRTPLAELRTATDVALRWHDDEELRARTVDEANRIAVQMQQIVSLLLHLARVEAGDAPLSPATVDIARMVRRHCERAAGDGGSRRVDFDVETTEALSYVDAQAADLVIRNLVDNAHAYTPEGGLVQCSVRANGAGVQVEVVNPSAELEAEDLPGIAEPFWRKDAARSDSSHLGLGLTMARAVARAAGVDLELTLENGRFVARVGLPPDRNGHPGPLPNGAAHPSSCQTS